MQANRAPIKVVVLALFVASGCIDRGEQLVASCDVDPDPPTWQYVSAAVMQPSCGTASCHSTLTQRAGVILDDAALGYRSLLDATPEPFVRAGAPQDSRVLYLLEGVEVDTRMPPDAPLPDADIELVQRWICAGAEDN